MKKFFCVSGEKENEKANEIESGTKDEKIF